MKDHSEYIGICEEILREHGQPLHFIIVLKIMVVRYHILAKPGQILYWLNHSEKISKINPGVYSYGK